MTKIDIETIALNLCAAAYDRVNFQASITDLFDLSAQKIVILASNEFEGFSKNGGIGTYYTTLSQKLKGDGWYVILLLCHSDNDYIGQPHPPNLDHIFTTGQLPHVLDLQPVHQAILDDNQQEGNQQFDLESWRCLFFTQAIVAAFPDAVIYVEFPAIWGFGCRTIQAKQSGILGSGCFVGVTDHGGFEWLREINSRYLTHTPRWFWQAYHYEQYSYDHANLTCSPSHFLRSKVETYGWDTSHAVHLPYFIPLVPAVAEADALQATSLNIDRTKIPIVFFGRLEERKGLCTFLEAIQILHTSDPTWHDRVCILFLGKIANLESYQLQGLDSQVYIEQTLPKNLEYQLLTNLSSQEAIATIICLDAPIVCLCSLQENFPNAALEMGQLPVSLIVSDTGGFRETLELVTRTDGVHWFHPGDSQSLAQTLSHVINSHPETPIVPNRTTLEQINAQLLDQRLEYMTEAFLAAPPKEIPQPLVTVGIPGVADIGKLADCLESLAAQSYQNLEVIVLYSTSLTGAEQATIAQAKAQFPQYQFFDTTFADRLGAVYNQLVDRATGAYFLPLTPDRLLLPPAIETFIQAAGEAEAMIVTSPDMTLDQDNLEVITFIDGSLLKLLEFNQSRDLCALFSLEWLRSLPYCEERELRALNWHLLAAALATGIEIAYYPYPLYLSDRHAALSIAPETFAKERYYLRQFLSQIEPARWTKRQLHLLLTCIEQLWQAEAAQQSQWGQIAQKQGYAEAQSAQAQAWMQTALQTQAEVEVLQSALEKAQTELVSLQSKV